MSVINFIISSVLTQAPITLALIAMVGLLLQKKGPGQVVTGTLKTLLGFQVLAAGAGIIVQSLNYFGEIFTAGFNMQGIVPSIEAINGQAMTTLGLGSQIAMSFLAIFIVNVLIARFTKWKYIFLTGQALLWMSTICVVFGSLAGFKGVMLILTSGIVGGVFTVLMPALAQPIVRKITGSNDIALGHFCTFGYLLEAGIANLFGNKSQSTEDIIIPKSLEFLQDTNIAVMVVMVPLYIITAFFAGEEFCRPLAGNVNYLMHSFLQAIQFVVGVYVLLAGVRLLLGEIVPAFRGISQKLVPNAIPALDCPVLFPYAPNAVIIGFITTVIGSIIGMIVLPIFGLAMILPGMLTAFFAGGTAGVFGNAMGGLRGAIIGGVIHGFFITLLPALLVGVLTQIGFVGATVTDVDTAVAAFIYAWVIIPLMRF